MPKKKIHITLLCGAQKDWMHFINFTSGDNKYEEVLNLHYNNNPLLVKFSRIKDGLPVEFHGVPFMIVTMEE